VVDLEQAVVVLFLQLLIVDRDQLVGALLHDRLRIDLELARRPLDHERDLRNPLHDAGVLLVDLAPLLPAEIVKVILRDVTNVELGCADLRRLRLRQIARPIEGAVIAGARLHLVFLGQVGKAHVRTSFCSGRREQTAKGGGG